MYIIIMESSKDWAVKPREDNNLQNGRENKIVMDIFVLKVIDFNF